MMPRFFTSYFSAVSRIMKQSPDMVFISISRFPPAWWLDIGGLQYKSLAPEKDLLLKMKRDGDRYHYVHRFKEHLSRLDPETVVRELLEMSGGNDICLLCFENLQRHDFCHRTLVSAWLNDYLPQHQPCVEWDENNQKEDAIF